MRQFKALFLMTLRQFIRDPFAAAFSFVFPLLFLVSMGAGERGGNYSNLRILVVGADAVSSDTIHAAWRDDRTVVVRDGDAASATEELIHRHVDVVLRQRGDTYEVSVISGREPAARSVAEHLELALLRARQPSLPHSVSVTEVAVPRYSHFAYTAPGIMALALLQLGLYGTGNQILMARARGLLRRIACTPLKTRQIVSAHISVRLIVAVLQVAMLLGIAHWIFRFPVPNLALLAIPVLLGATTLSLLGYLIGMTARTQYSGGLILLLSNLYMIFFGQSINDNRAGEYSAVMAYANPLSYLADSFREVLTGQPGMLSFWQNQAALGLWMLVFALITAQFYRPFQEDR